MGIRMARKIWLILLLMITIMISASCSPGQVSPTSQPDMPNPASVYCEQEGSRLEIITAAD
ncbi:MAG: DUF333 domain-containing protein [Candidatus Promineifilaceae bacterium]